MISASVCPPRKKEIGQMKSTVPSRGRTPVWLLFALFLPGTSAAAGFCRRRILRCRERLLHFSGGGPQARILLQHARKESIQSGGNARPEPRHRDMRIGQNGVQHVDLRFGIEGMAAGREFVENYPEREDIGGRGGGFSSPLLGRHIAHGAQQRAWIGCRTRLGFIVGAGCCGNARQAEIQHLDVSIAAVASMRPLLRTPTTLTISPW